MNTGTIASWTTIHLELLRATSGVIADLPRMCEQMQQCCAVMSTYLGEHGTRSRNTPASMVATLKRHGDAIASLHDSIDTRLSFARASVQQFHRIPSGLGPDALLERRLRVELHSVVSAIDAARDVVARTRRELVEAFDGVIDAAMSLDVPPEIVEETMRVLAIMRSAQD